MCYTNPARCIQAVSMAMERVIVELRRSPPRSPPRWTRVPGPHQRFLRVSAELRDQTSGRGGGAPETGISGLFIPAVRWQDARAAALSLGNTVSRDAKSAGRSFPAAGVGCHWLPPPARANGSPPGARHISGATRGQRCAAAGQRLSHGRAGRGAPPRASPPRASLPRTSPPGTSPPTASPPRASPPGASPPSIRRCPCARCRPPKAALSHSLAAVWEVNLSSGTMELRDLCK